MSETCANIRQATSARVLELGGAWRESKFHYDAFGADAASSAHQTYAVGVGRTTTLDDRQKVTEGAFVKTEIKIRATFRQRPKDPVVSADEALDLEQTLVQKIMQDTATWPRTFRPLLRTIDRVRDASGEWTRSDIVFDAYHHYALQ